MRARGAVPVRVADAPRASHLPPHGGPLDGGPHLFNQNRSVSLNTCGEARGEATGLDKKTLIKAGKMERHVPRVAFFATLKNPRGRAPHRATGHLPTRCLWPPRWQINQISCDQVFDVDVWPPPLRAHSNSARAPSIPNRGSETLDAMARRTFDRKLVALRRAPLAAARKCMCPQLWEVLSRTLSLLCTYLKFAGARRRLPLDLQIINLAARALQFARAAPANPPARWNHDLMVCHDTRQAHAETSCAYACRLDVIERSMDIVCVQISSVLLARGRHVARS